MIPSPDPSAAALGATFDAERPRLIGLAYRMLGSAAEAEDVVQSAWLRFRTHAETVEEPRAWLAKVVTRLCLDELRSARARRETYVGPWLPEPVRTDGGPFAALPAEVDSLSLAFLRVLETLTPLERAVFLLREVFDYEYREIAAVLERTEAACRQIGHRATEHVALARTRFSPSRAEHERLLQAFLLAVGTGDSAALARLLADDVVFTADGGGKVLAALRPVRGASAVTRLVLGLARKGGARFRSVPAVVNGLLAVLVYEGDRLDGVFAVETDGERVVAIYNLRNPDKLRFV